MPRPRTYDEARHATAVRLPEALHRRLRTEAAARQVSANLLVERAIAEYLDHLPPLDAVLATSADGVIAGGPETSRG
jgi:predicted transcriptional regulator